MDLIERGRGRNTPCHPYAGFLMYVTFLTILSVSISMIPLGMRISGNTRALTYVSGSAFWAGLVGTFASAACITISRRRSRDFDKRRLGLVHFFQNRPALISDILLFLSLPGFVCACVWAGMTICPFLFLSLLIFSFGMHCMLNGSNYIYIKQKIRSVTES